jgi:hypothetical protein
MESLQRRHSVSTSTMPTWTRRRCFVIIAMNPSEDLGVDCGAEDAGVGVVGVVEVEVEVEVGVVDVDVGGVVGVVEVEVEVGVEVGVRGGFVGGGAGEGGGQYPKQKMST